HRRSRAAVRGSSLHCRPRRCGPCLRRSRDLPGRLSGEDMVRIFEAYSEAKTRGRLLDFDDVLLVLSGVLAEYPAIAAEIRDQYRHFVVDEFQDVSPLQFDVLS